MTGRLRLDVDRHVKDVVDKDTRLRFEESVEVLGKTPQGALEEHFDSREDVCGAAGGGAPSEADMRDVRVQPAPSLNILGVAQALAGLIKRRGEDKFFLYRVRKADSVSYVLHETKLPASTLFGSPGLIYELIDAFPDRGSATRAWRRVEQGLPPRPAKEPSGFVPSPCLPR